MFWNNQLMEIPKEKEGDLDPKDLNLLDFADNEKYQEKLL